MVLTKTLALHSFSFSICLDLPTDNMATEESMANSEMATLVLGAYQWKVPVETLVSHSSFFKAALTSGFKVGG